MNRKENQIIGIRNAQQKGIYIGRKPGTYESKEKFISKPKNKEAIELLRNGVKGCVVSEKLELNPNTVSKVKKIAKEMNLI
jgi:DNA invertase Pin-like site-specific DNA recombinase